MAATTERKCHGCRRNQQRKLGPNRPSSEAVSNFSFFHGDFAITVLSDGFITVPIDIIAPEGSPDERAEILRRTGHQSSGLVKSKTNIPVIKKGDDLIIVDIGSGDKYQPSDGRLSGNLLSSGIDAGRNH